MFMRNTLPNGSVDRNPRERVEALTQITAKSLSKSWEVGIFATPRIRGHFNRGLPGGAGVALLVWYPLLGRNTTQLALGTAQRRGQHPRTIPC